MATFTHTAYSTSRLRVRVGLSDDGLDLKLVKGSLRLERESAGDWGLGPFARSSCSWEVVADDDASAGYMGVTLPNLLTTAPERVPVVVERQTPRRPFPDRNPGDVRVYWEVLWRGYLAPELYVEQDRSLPRFYRLSAVDGLDQSFDVPYAPTADSPVPFSGTATLAEHLSQALKLAGLGGVNTRLRNNGPGAYLAATDWLPAPDADDLLSHVRLPHRAFWRLTDAQEPPERVNRSPPPPRGERPRRGNRANASSGVRKTTKTSADGTYEFDSCGDVIEKICLSLGLVCHVSDRGLAFVQPWVYAAQSADGQAGSGYAAKVYDNGGKPAVNIVGLGRARPVTTEVGGLSFRDDPTRDIDAVGARAEGEFARANVPREIEVSVDSGALEQLDFLADVAYREAARFENDVDEAAVDAGHQEAGIENFAEVPVDTTGAVTLGYTDGEFVVPGTLTLNVRVTSTVTVEGRSGVVHDWAPVLKVTLKTDSESYSASGEGGLRARDKPGESFELSFETNTFGASPGRIRRDRFGRPISGTRGSLRRLLPYVDKEFTFEIDRPLQGDLTFEMEFEGLTRTVHRYDQTRGVFLEGEIYAIDEIPEFADSSWEVSAELVSGSLRYEGDQLQRDPIRIVAEALPIRTETLELQPPMGTLGAPGSLRWSVRSGGAWGRDASQWVSGSYGPTSSQQLLATASAAYVRGAGRVWEGVIHAPWADLDQVIQASGALAGYWRMVSGGLNAGKSEGRYVRIGDAPYDPTPPKPPVIVSPPPRPPKPPPGPIGPGGIDGVLYPAFFTGGDSSGAGDDSPPTGRTVFPGGSSGPVRSGDVVSVVSRSGSVRELTVVSSNRDGSVTLSEGVEADVMIGAPVRPRLEPTGPTVQRVYVESAAGPRRRVPVPGFTPVGVVVYAQERALSPVDYVADAYGVTLAREQSGWVRVEWSTPAPPEGTPQAYTTPVEDGDFLPAPIGLEATLPAGADQVEVTVQEIVLSPADYAVEPTGIRLSAPREGVGYVSWTAPAPQARALRSVTGTAPTVTIPPALTPTLPADLNLLRVAVQGRPVVHESAAPAEGVTFAVVNGEVTLSEAQTGWMRVTWLGTLLALLVCGGASAQVFPEEVRVRTERLSTLTRGASDLDDWIYKVDSLLSLSGVVGNDGVGVDTAYFDDRDRLVLELTDGSTATSPPLAGEDGVGVADATFDPVAATLTLTFTDGSSVTTDDLRGPAGRDGAGVEIVGSVPTEAALPNPYAGEAGDLIIVQATGHGWVYDGAQFNNVGQIRGPVGPVGPPGAGGAQGPAGPSDWDAIPNVPPDIADGDQDDQTAAEVQEDAFGDVQTALDTLIARVNRGLTGGGGVPADGVVTGATIAGSTVTLTRSEGLADLTFDLPADQVRTDAEIEALARVLADSAQARAERYADANDQVGIEVELDPVFLASLAATFTESDTLRWGTDRFEANTDAQAAGEVPEDNFGEVQTAIDSLVARVNRGLSGQGGAVADGVVTTATRDGVTVTLTRSGGLADLTFDLPADKIRSDAEIEALAQVLADTAQARAQRYADANDDDTQLSPEQVRDFARGELADTAAAIRADLPSSVGTDTPRSDAEIDSIARSIVYAAEDRVRAYAEAADDQTLEEVTREDSVSAVRSYWARGAQFTTSPQGPAVDIRDESDAAGVVLLRSRQYGGSRKPGYELVTRTDGIAHNSVFSSSAPYQYFSVAGTDFMRMGGSGIGLRLPKAAGGGVRVLLTNDNGVVSASDIASFYRVGDALPTPTLAAVTNAGATTTTKVELDGGADVRAPLRVDDQTSTAGSVMFEARQFGGTARPGMQVVARADGTSLNSVFSSAAPYQYLSVSGTDYLRLGGSGFGLRIPRAVGGGVRVMLVGDEGLVTGSDIASFYRAGDALPWASLSGVPAGFADGTDDERTDAEIGSVAQPLADDAEAAANAYTDTREAAIRSDFPEATGPQYVTEIRRIDFDTLTDGAIGRRPYMSTRSTDSPPSLNLPPGRAGAYWTVDVLPRYNRGQRWRVVATEWVPPAGEVPQVYWRDYNPAPGPWYAPYVPDTPSGDNLGDHTATQALDMAANDITGVGNVTFDQGALSDAVLGIVADDKRSGGRLQYFANAGNRAVADLDDVYGSQSDMSTAGPMIDGRKFYVLNVPGSYELPDPDAYEVGARITVKYMGTGGDASVRPQTGHLIDDRGPSSVYTVKTRGSMRFRADPANDRWWLVGRNRIPNVSP